MWKLQALLHPCKLPCRCTLKNHLFTLAGRDFTDCHRFWQGENDFQALCCLKEALPHHIDDCTQWLLLVTHFQMDPPVAAAVIKSCLLSASLGVSCLTMSGTYICGLQLHHGKCKVCCKMKKSNEYLNNKLLKFSSSSHQKRLAGDLAMYEAHKSNFKKESSWSVSICTNCQYMLCPHQPD